MRYADNNQLPTMSLTEVTGASIPVLNSISHSMLQLTAIPLGIVVDWGFDAGLRRLDRLAGTTLDRQAPSIGNVRRALAESIEVAAQVVTGGLVVGAMGSYLLSLGAEDTDPAGGAIFGIAYFASQRRLQRRLFRLIEFVDREFLAARSAVENKMRDWQRPHPQTEFAHAASFGVNSASDTRLAQQLGVAPPGALGGARPLRI